MRAIALRADDLQPAAGSAGWSPCDPAQGQFLGNGRGVRYVLALDVKGASWPCELRYRHASGQTLWCLQQAGVRRLISAIQVETVLGEDTTIFRRRSPAVVVPSYRPLHVILQADGRPSGLRYTAWEVL